MLTIYGQILDETPEAFLFLPAARAERSGCGAFGQARHYSKLQCARGPERYGLASLRMSGATWRRQQSNAPDQPAGALDSKSSVR